MLAISSIFTLLFTQAVRAVGPPPGSIMNLVTFGDSYTDLNAGSDGGIPWPQYVADEGHFTLHSYANSGAVCDHRLTPRSFPSIIQDELPTFFNDTAHGLRLVPEETMYTLWIGTNDLGFDEMMSGGNTPGTTIIDTTACAMQWIKTLYAAGARNFVFQNVIIS